MTALFTIAKIWKECKCLSTDACIKKMWNIYIYIYTHTHILLPSHIYMRILVILEYYSVIKKKNEILPFATAWLNLEGIILNEVNQTKKGKYCMFSLTCGI